MQCSIASLSQPVLHPLQINALNQKVRLMLRLQPLFVLCNDRPVVINRRLRPDATKDAEGFHELFCSVVIHQMKVSDDYMVMVW
jgi:hypothetical protein